MSLLKAGRPNSRSERQETLLRQIKDIDNGWARLNAQIKPSMLKKLKLISYQKDLSMSQIIVQLVEKYIDENKSLIE